MMDKFNKLLGSASGAYVKNFSDETYFGRCIFLSWYCELGTCKFCFRSTQKHKIRHAKRARRSKESILADAVIGKALGWHIEFLTGGYKIFPFEDIVDIAKNVSEIYNRRIWVNLGTLNDRELKLLQPYTEGVCASIETVNPELHRYVCPDKDIEPYEEMLTKAKQMGFKTSITIVIGLGEKKEDFLLLEKFIRKHDLDQITFYALKPVKETPFTESPDPKYYAWWIAKTRIAFPKLKIMAGLTPKNVEYTKYILKAGANGITKFPAIKQFNSEKARRIEELAKECGREFKGSLTKIPDTDWEEIINNIRIGPELKGKLRHKVLAYVKKMSEKHLNTR